MPISNLSNVVFNDAETTQLNDSITALNSVLLDKATNLTQEERRRYGSINEENKLMVQKTIHYAASNPKIIPSHLDMEEFNRDNASRLLLNDWTSKLRLILTHAENTKILLDYDVFQSCLTIYRNIRYLANEDMAGMHAIYNDLKQFFPGGGNSSSAPESPVSNS